MTDETRKLARQWARNALKDPTVRAELIDMARAITAGQPADRVLCARCYTWVPRDALEPPLDVRGRSVWRRAWAWLNGDTAPRPPVCRRCAGE
jgi:hypothetical protein